MKRFIFTSSIFFLTSLNVFAAPKALDEYKTIVPTQRSVETGIDRHSNRFTSSGEEFEKNLISGNKQILSQDSFLNKYINEYNHTGIYIFTGASYTTMMDVSGNHGRHSGQDYNGIKFPKQDLGFGFYVGLGGRWQTPYYLNLGLEAFYHMPKATNLSNWVSTGISAANPAGTTAVNLDSKLTVQGIIGMKFKLGLSIWRFTPYATVGYAYLMANDKTTNSAFAPNTSTSTINDSSSANSHGYLYGGGLEFLATDNIILRFEYTEYMFNYSHKIMATTNGVTAPIVEAAGSSQPRTYSDSLRLSQFIFGVSFKF
jgi:opacity protein-like surface antigen